MTEDKEHKSKGGHTDELVQAEHSSGLTPTEAKELVEKSFGVALDSIRENAAPRQLGPLGVVTASESDITDELTKGGPAFGSFVRSVGLAVADAQSALDENLRKTAETLSKTQIDVIAIFEQVINDQGSMDNGIVHMQKLPLINYLMPTAYHWKRVHLVADMKVSEFNSANGFHIQSASSSTGTRLGAGFGLFNGFGVTRSASSRSSSTAYEGSYSQDVAVGSMHMEATLEPRADIQLPQPFVLQKGPRLKLSLDKREEVDKNNAPITDPTKVVGRKITLTAHLAKTNGDNHSGQKLEVSVDNPLLQYTASGVTDAQGNLVIEILRKDAAFDKNINLNAQVRVWFGLVSETMGINI